MRLKCCILQRWFSAIGAQLPWPLILPEQQVCAGVFSLEAIDHRHLDLCVVLHQVKFSFCSLHSLKCLLNFRVLFRHVVCDFTRLLFLLDISLALLSVFCLECLFGRDSIDTLNCINRGKSIANLSHSLLSLPLS
eukprot:13914_6